MGQRRAEWSSGDCFRGQPGLLPGLRSVAVMKHRDQKQLGEERGFFGLLFHISEGEGSGQELKQEQRQDPWESAVYWLAPHALLRLLSFVSRHHLPRAGPAHSGLGPPTLIINRGKKNCSTDFPTGPFDGRDSSSDAPPTQGSGLCQVDQNKTKLTSTSPLLDPAPDFWAQVESRVAPLVLGSERGPGSGEERRSCLAFFTI